LPLGLAGHIDPRMSSLEKNDAAKSVERTYLALTLLATLAASLIWGINTLFLLDAGLNNTEAFTANAFFTAGQMLFEIPTGVIADTWGRRTSFLLGAATLLVSTLVYVLMWRVHAPLWAWALGSMFIGLGFTFFSGATEAWLVDALTFTGHEQRLEQVFAHAQVVTGVAMLSGTLAGGYLAQQTNLGVPYLVRAALLLITLAAAAYAMKDLGFTPARKQGTLHEVRTLLRASLDAGFRNPPVRWLMLAGLCSGGVGIFAFYAFSPYLLDLYGDRQAFALSGLAAAITASAQIASGLVAPQLWRVFSRRTHVLLFSALAVAITLFVLSEIDSVPLALGVLLVWSACFRLAFPIRQTYLNGVIPSSQRATVLSFDNLMASAGGVVSQPALGRVADVSGYPFAFLMCGLLQLASLPFIALARAQRASSDPLEVSIERP
jgi:MFS family permease